MTTTTTTDPRAALPARLEQLEDAAAGLGLRVAEGGLDEGALAVLLSAADGACKLLDAARRALPATEGAEAGGSGESPA
jgi:hypothetical protein